MQKYKFAAVLGPKSLGAFNWSKKGSVSGKLAIMKGTALILLCAFALGLSEEIELNANGCPVDFTIHKVLEHDKYCNLFYSCDRGEKVELRCPGELTFNSKEGVCDWPWEVDCGDKGIFEYVPESGEDNNDGNNPGGNNDPGAAAEICAKEDSDGVLVAHKYCNKFYKCEGGLPVAQDCPGGLVYNYNQGYCDWPFNVECGDRVISAAAVDKPDSIYSKPHSVHEVCARKDSENLLLPHEYCNRFYQCSSGHPVALSCPSGLVFNPELSLCDWQSNVNCHGKPIVEEEKEDNDNGNNVESGSGGHGHSNPSEAPAICAAENSDGVLVAHEICSLFYKCDHGVPVPLDCPFNLLYNPKYEICDWPKNVDCGNRVHIFKRR